jgi:hypothetical protein
VSGTARFLREPMRRALGVRGIADFARAGADFFGRKFMRRPRRVGRLTALVAGVTPLLRVRRCQAEWLVVAPVRGQRALHMPPLLLRR